MNTDKPVHPLMAPAIGDLLFSSSTDSAIARLLPALPESSPAVVIIRECAAKFKEADLTPEVSVAVALNLVAALASTLMTEGVQRGKLINALPEELRGKLKVALPPPLLPIKRRP